MSEVICSYAEKQIDGDGKVWYNHFFQSRVQMAMCGVENPVAVDMWWVDPSYVTDHFADSEDQWMWGWYDLDKQEFVTFLTQSTKSVFNMQFAYGPQVEQDRGRGKIVRVFVTEVNKPPVDI